MQQKGKLRGEDKYPESVQAFSFFTEAFLELDTDRPTGFGLSAIPFTSIMNYARIYDVEDTEEFIYLIRRMDQKYLSLNKEKNSGNGNPNTKNSNKNRQ